MTETVTTDWESWQRQWDAQQEAYLPDREERFAAMLDAVEASLPEGAAPRVLDLAGGTGSISRRVLDRFPHATTVVLDVDAALLTIARGTFVNDERVEVLAGDLEFSSWAAAFEPASFDAVLTATALHWLKADRVAGVYAEALPLLKPGGLFVNADGMHDESLESLREGLQRVEKRRTRQRWDSGVPSWEGWWDLLREDPLLAGPTAERDAFYAERRGDGHTQSLPSVNWHLEALRAAGYAEAGLVWRGLLDAAVTGRASLA
ncbi:class I SAM-dependent methyltransferase [Kineosporia succinea]|uniref:SAM-dependent methyltransferase n=1 Tax=Kineosporia succinea TaxID=84632 RepID=A0ABT9NWL9_9ACTN|nr:class I SAM-dependent methyltransferase [Kineosporia succinea]MDP9824549.1 SAM-dependent methyltransferase [Kineosporia succinea]